MCAGGDAEAPLRYRQVPVRWVYVFCAEKDGNDLAE